MATSVRKVCKHAGDDRAHQARPAPFPGPRCTTCQRVRRKDVRAAGVERRSRQVYGLAAGDRAKILAAQGGLCAGCGQWTRRGDAGRKRCLATDHDHKQARLDGHPVEQGCPACVRGLLCATCNKIIGWVHDNPLILVSLANYLLDPPAKAILKGSEL